MKRQTSTARRLLAPLMSLLMVMTRRGKYPTPADGKPRSGMTRSGAVYAHRRRKIICSRQDAAYSTIAARGRTPTGRSIPSYISVLPVAETAKDGSSGSVRV